MVEIRAPQPAPQPAAPLPTDTPAVNQPPQNESSQIESPRVEPKLTVGQQDSIDSEAITQSSVLPPPIDGQRPRADLPSHPSERFLKDATSAGSDPAGKPGAEATLTDESAPASWALQSAAAQQRRQWMLVSLVLLFGMVVSAVLFYQFVSNWQQTAQVDPVNDSEVNSTDTTSVETVAADAADKATTPPDNNAAITEPAVAPEPTADDLSTKTDTAAETMSDPSVPSTEAGDAVANPATAGTDVANVMPTESTDASSTGGPNAPETPPLVVRGAAEPPAAPLTDLPEGLRKFAPLMSFDTTGNQDARPLEAPPSIDSVQIEAAAKELEKGETKQGRKPIDLKRAMSLRFALDNRGASLCELMLVLSQLTTVPIELELISLDAAGISVHAPMKSPKGTMTAQEWLARLCQEQGLATFNLPDRILVSADEKRINAGLAPALNIADLPGDKQQILQLLNVVTHEVTPEPAEQNNEAAAPQDPAAPPAEAPAEVFVTLADDGVTIIPEPSPRAAMRAALTLESLRQLYDLPPKLKPEFTSRWTGAWPAGPAGENIPNTSTFGEWPLVSGGKALSGFDSPRAVAGILHDLADVNDRHLMVVWGDAVFQDLYPADALMPYTPDDDAGSLLNEVLGEQNLEARVCGPQLWVVMTAATYDRLEVITWLPIAPGSETLIQQRLAASLEIDDPSTLPLSFINDCLVIRCPRFIARQLHRVIAP